MTTLTRLLAPVFALVAVAALAGVPVRAASREKRVTIAFTGDVGGYLEPCG